MRAYDHSTSQTSAIPTAATPIRLSTVTLPLGRAAGAGSRNKRPSLRGRGFAGCHFACDTKLDANSIAVLPGEARPMQDVVVALFSAKATDPTPS